METCFQRLLKNPDQFDFFQAVRLLHASASKPRGSCIGRASQPDQEIVRFKVKDSLSFPTTRVEQFFLRPNEKMTMIVSFLGLTGPGGVLPNHYTELMLQRRQVKDTSLLDFFDLFNHRTLSLLYRAWEKYRPHLNSEHHCFTTKTRDPLTQVLSSLSGIEDFNSPPHQAVSAKALIYLTPFFMHLTRSAFTLAELLNHYFQLPIRVKQFQGSWLLLDEMDQSCLANKGTKRFTQLGVNTVLGTRVWDLQTKFRLVIGPLSLRKFNELAPNGDLCKSLKHLTRLYAGPILNFDLELTLEAEDIPYCILSSKSNQSLGWNTWLKSKNPRITAREL